MAQFIIAATAYYRLLPTGWDLPTAWSDAGLYVLWGFGLILTAGVTAQGFLHRRRVQAALPDRLDLLTAAYPRWAGMETALGAVGLALCPLAYLILGRPGVWQGAFLAAYMLGLLIHRHFNPLAGLAAATLASLGLLGLPLAVAGVLAPRHQAHELTAQQVLLVGGFASLLAALVWAECAWQWRRQEVHGRPISTAHRMTWAALLQAIAGLILAAFCLAPAFQRG